MHEFTIAQSLLETALAVAGEQRARRISVVRLRIGGLRQVVEEALRLAFEILAEGTIAAGCAMEIDWLPSIWRCSACGRILERAADLSPRPADEEPVDGVGVARFEPAADESCLTLAGKTRPTCPCGNDSRTFEGNDDLLLTSLDLECDEGMESQPKPLEGATE